MSSSRHILLVFVLTLISALVFTGCVAKRKPVDETTTPVSEKPVKSVVKEPEIEYQAGDKTYPEGYYVHTVRVPNENISIIAGWYTGDQKNWVVLTKCNPTIKPNRIFLGNRIKIPRRMITRRTPLPPEFVQHSLGQQQKRKKNISRTKASTTPASPGNEEAPLLFGPKGF